MEITDKTIKIGYDEFKYYYFQATESFIKGNLKYIVPLNDERELVITNYE